MAQEIKPGCLVKLSWREFSGYNIVERSQIVTVKGISILTVKSIYSPEGGFDFTFEETGFNTFWRYPSEVSLIASTMESIPLEDWAGLAHLLHPKLKERVEKWLSQTKI